MRHYTDQQSQDQNVHLLQDSIAGIIFPPKISDLHVKSSTGYHTHPPDTLGNSWPEDLSHLALSNLQATQQR